MTRGVISQDVCLERTYSYTYDLRCLDDSLRGELGDLYMVSRVAYSWLMISGMAFIWVNILM